MLLFSLCFLELYKFSTNKLEVKMTAKKEKQQLEVDDQKNFTKIKPIIQFFVEYDFSDLIDIKFDKNSIHINCFFKNENNAETQQKDIKSLIYYNVALHCERINAENFLNQILNILEESKNEILKGSNFSKKNLNLFEEFWNTQIQNSDFNARLLKYSLYYYKKYLKEIEDYCSNEIKLFEEDVKDKCKNEKKIFIIKNDVFAIKSKAFEQIFDKDYTNIIYKDFLEVAVKIFISLLKNNFKNKTIEMKAKFLRLNDQRENMEKKFSSKESCNFKSKKPKDQKKQKTETKVVKIKSKHVFYSLKTFLENEKISKTKKIQVEIEINFEDEFFFLILQIFYSIKHCMEKPQSADQTIRLIYLNVGAMYHHFFEENRLGQINLRNYIMKNTDKHKLLSNINIKNCSDYFAKNITDNFFEEQNPFNQTMFSNSQELIYDLVYNYIGFSLVNFFDFMTVYNENRFFGHNYNNMIKDFILNKPLSDAEIINLDLKENDYKLFFTNKKIEQSISNFLLYTIKRYIKKHELSFFFQDYDWALRFDKKTVINIEIYEANQNYIKEQEKKNFISEYSITFKTQNTAENEIIEEFSNSEDIKNNGKHVEKIPKQKETYVKLKKEGIHIASANQENPSIDIFDDEILEKTIIESEDGADTKVIYKQPGINLDIQPQQIYNIQQPILSKKSKKKI
ncbi:hypothetical protein GVAV_002156 [Gurleya vavrai]